MRHAPPTTGNSNGTPATDGQLNGSATARGAGKPGKIPRQQPPPTEGVQYDKLFLRTPATVARDKQLGPTDKLVYAQLLRYQGKNTACTRSYDQISRATGLAKRSVNRAIQRLQQKGYIRPATTFELSRDTGEKHGEHGGITRGWVCLRQIASKANTVPNWHR